MISCQSSPSFSQFGKTNVLCNMSWGLTNQGCFRPTREMNSEHEVLLWGLHQVPMDHMPGLTQTQVGGMQGSLFPTSPWATISCQLAPWVSTMSQTWGWGEERWNKSRAGAASGVGGSCSARWEIHSSANWMGSLGSFFFFLSNKHFFSTSSVVLTAHREADQAVDGFSCDLSKMWFQVQ